jgi:hypothetical protein
MKIYTLVIKMIVATFYKGLSFNSMGYGLHGRGSISGREERLFSLHTVQTNSGAYPISYPMGKRGYFLGGKADGE